MEQVDSITDLPDCIQDFILEQVFPEKFRFIVDHLVNQPNGNDGVGDPVQISVLQLARMIRTTG